MVTVATIGLAIGCSQREEQAVCVDGSNRVVSRESCNTNRAGGGYFWYYHAAYAAANRYPTVGTQAPSGGRMVRATGPVSRGGFGTSARARSAAT